IDADRITKTISDPLEQVKAFAAIARAQRKNGDTQAATNTLDTMQRVATAIHDEKIHAKALTTIVQTQIQHGDMIDADRITKTISDPLEQVKAFAAIARAQRKNGDTQAATNTLDTARAIATNIPSNVTRDMALAIVITLLAQQGEFTAARAIADTITTRATRDVIPGEESQAHALATLSQSLATAGETHQLLDLVQQEWRKATTRDHLLNLIPLVTPLFANNAEIAPAIVRSFDWVDEMLKR
ncbi:MAG: hypothetical protein AAGF95_34385, partial [Chloroflexota bacterium]